MKKKLLTLALAAVMVVSSAVTSFAAETEEKVLWSSSEAYTLDGTLGTAQSIDNPLLGVDTDKIILEYSLTSSKQYAAWNGLAEFYNDSEGSLFNVVCVAFWPQIQFNNDGKWAEVGAGASNILADSNWDGKAHTYKYVITASSVEVYVDGTKYAVDALKGNSENITTVEEQAAALFNAISTAEHFSLGCVKSFENWGELDNTSTVNSFKISAVVEKPVTPPAGENPPAGGNGGNGGNGAPDTADMAPVVAVVALAAVAAAVVLKKRTVND